MSLKQKIQTDFKEAFKGQKHQEASTLKLLLSVLQLKEKEKKFQLLTKEKLTPEQVEAKGELFEDKDIVSIIAGEVKKLKDALAEAQKVSRADLSDKAQIEIEILSKYLPQQLNSEDLKKIIQEAITQTGAKDQKDMGKVLKEVLPKVQGSADNSLVSSIVKEMLSHQ